MSTDICRWLFLLFFLTTSTTQSNSKEIRVVCYYTNWSVYRPGPAKFSPQNINPYLCTHLIYAFGGFTKDNTLKPFDKYQDIEKGGYAKFTGLKTYNKNLKTMLAIGGWNEGSSRFSPMVASADRRRELVKNSIKFLRQNHFDGLDLDWEYPSFRDGGKSRDRDNYAHLVQELREEFDRESEKTGRPRLLLTMAVPAGIEYINKGYDVPKLTKYLDWMNILSYDYHSAFEPAVNHHAPLYALEEPSEYNYDTELNIEYTIQYYLEQGADPTKLVLGIPTYGRSYTLFNPDANEIGAPADGPGDMGEATRENGYLAYYEICENIKSQNWEVVQPDPDTMGPYAFKGNQWVGYDDDAIARKKAAYVAKKGLGGIMFWSIDNDDFRGTCHGKPYPIIEAAKEELILAYGLGNENAISKPSAKPTKSKPRTRTPSRAKNASDNKIETSTKKPVSSSGTRRRNRLKTKSNNISDKTKTLRKEPIRSTTDSIVHSSLELVTPSYTTPAPPSTPDQGGAFKCEDDGFYPHPKDCKKYFWCLSGPGELGIVAHQFTCPAGLYFNKAADSCDYTQNVLCNKKLSRTTTSSSTTTTTTTPSPSTKRVLPKITAATSRTTFFRTTTTTAAYDNEDEYEYEDEEEDAKNSEEDPRVIKELLDLIKKAGGIEELEKQLHIHDNGTASVSNSDTTTPSSISKSLVERVLGKAAKTAVRKNSLFNRNSRGPQNEGLRTTEEKQKQDRGKLQYTTITRQKAQKEAIEEEEEEEEGVIDKAPKQPQYVNIRRGKISTTTVENEEDANSQLNRNKILGEEEEEDHGEYQDSSTRKATSPQYVNIRRQRPSTTEESSSSKYAVIKRGTTTEEPNNVQKRRGTTIEPEISENKRRGTTPIPDTTTIITTTVKTKYKILRRGSTTQSTTGTPETTIPSRRRNTVASLPPTSPSNTDIKDKRRRPVLSPEAADENTTFNLDLDDPTTILELLVTTPESFKTNTNHLLVQGLKQSSVIPPLLLEPRPFSLSTKEQTTSVKPVIENSTQNTKVSESNYKVRGTSTSSTTEKLRIPSRFKPIFDIDKQETRAAAVSPISRQRLRVASKPTTTTESSYEEYDLNRSYRPSEIADLSSLTAVDFSSLRDLNKLNGKSKSRRIRPSTTTKSTTTKTEETLKTSSRTSSIARNVLNNTIFGKSRRIIKKPESLEDQVNAGSETTNKIRNFTKVSTDTTPETEKTTKPTSRTRKIIRRLRPNSDLINKKRFEKPSTPSIETENLIENASTHPLHALERVIEDTNDAAEDISGEEGENIKLSESNIRENSNVNNQNVLDDDKKSKRKILKRIKSKVVGDLQIEDITVPAIISTEPNVIVRTRKIIRKLKPTESTITTLNTSTTQPSNALGRKRKIIRRLKPTTEKNDKTNTKPLHIRGRPFLQQQATDLKTKDYKEKLYKFVPKNTTISTSTEVDVPTTAIEYTTDFTATEAYNENITTEQNAQEIATTNSNNIGDNSTEEDEASTEEISTENIEEEAPTTIRYINPILNRQRNRPAYKRPKLTTEIPVKNTYLNRLKPKTYVRSSTSSPRIRTTEKLEEDKNDEVERKFIPKSKLRVNKVRTSTTTTTTTENIPIIAEVITSATDNETLTETDTTTTTVDENASTTSESIETSTWLESNKTVDETYTSTENNGNKINTLFDKEPLNSTTTPVPTTTLISVKPLSNNTTEETISATQLSKFNTRKTTLRTNSRLPFRLSSTTENLINIQDEADLIEDTTDTIDEKEDNKTTNTAKLFSPKLSSTTESNKKEKPLKPFSRSPYRISTKKPSLLNSRNDKKQTNSVFSSRFPQRFSSTLSTLEQKDEEENIDNEEQIDEVYTLRSTPKPKQKIINKPAGFSFRKTTETTKINDDLKDINTEAVKNRNKNLFSKKRKMNTPLALSTESSFKNDLITTESTTTSSVLTTTPEILVSVTRPTTIETSEYLTTLHHIFAETEPTSTEASSTEASTASSKLEKLIEVNRIVEVHEKNNTEADKDKVFDKVGVINRVKVVNIVDGTLNSEENEITESSSTSSESLEIATVKEITKSELNLYGFAKPEEREERKFEIYGSSKVVDYGKKAEIIDGLSHINVVTPRPLINTEASTISLEALFQADTPQKLNLDYKTSLSQNGGEELLETDNSRYVNIRVLEPDHYITMEAHVVENIRSGLFRRRPSYKPTPRSTTTTTTKATKATVPQRQKIKPVESQVERVTAAPLKRTDKYRFAPRKPFLRTTTKVPDQEMETSNQQSLEEDFQKIGNTEFTDIAALLQEFQLAPVPGNVGTTPSAKVTKISTRSRTRYTTPPPFPSSTQKLFFRQPKPKPQAFEKISSYSRSTFRSLPEYDYLDEPQTTFLEQIPGNSKVLLHSNGLIECLDQGSFPHPVSCKKFISCAKMENGNILGWEYTCPSDLSFDPIGGICNWSAGLGCSETK